MSEIYIFDRDDNLLSPITQSTGLISTWFKDHLNRVADEPFVFTVQADTKESRFVKAENQVAFRDKEGDYRLFVIKEIDDDDGPDGPQTIATCFPAFMVELKKRFIVDRRFVEQVAQKALDATLEGTRWKGIVSVDLGTATTNFYHMLSVDAIWKILEVWGGDFKDIVKFNGNKIVSREIHIVQRLGTDNGHRFEIDHNVEEIARTVISNPVTALYGYGASLEIEDENGEATGGFTRFISFADVEWKVSNGDPVDKPKGQPWVGDPEALQRYGLLHEGRRLHLEEEFSNQEYEDPAELLQATWEHLQKVKDPEVNYRLSVWLLERLPGYEHEKVSLGDTSRAIDRKFSRPIEIQARIIGLEYDIMDIERTAIAEMGQFLSVHDYDDRLDRVIENIRDNQGKWESEKKITDNSYPDITPTVPTRVQVYGAFQSIQIYWGYNPEVYVKYYEVYGSQVKGFAPDSQHLLHRGRLNGFNHVVETDQVWYYRIRAVNYQGKASGYTAEYSGSTVRIMSDDILFGPDLAASLRELSKISGILAPGSIGIENMKKDALDEINQSSQEYTQEEIQKVANDINRELADKADLSYVDGELLLKVDGSKYNTDVAGIRDTIAAVQVQVNQDVERLTSISDNLQLKVKAAEDALVVNQGKIISVEQNVDTINGSLSTAVSTLTALGNTVSEQRTLIDQQGDRIRFLASQDSLDQLTGRVNSTEASLTILNDRVSAKAEASEVYTKTEINTSLGKKVDTTIYNNKMSQLDVTVDGIRTNVKSVESEVSSVGTRILSAESLLDVQAGLISAKAEKNQVYTKTEADGRLTSEILKAKSEIKITTDGISTSVSQLNTKVDGIEVGGRNLFKGYGDQEITLYAYQGVGSFTQFFNLTMDAAEYVGEKFTISLYAKSPNGLTQLRLYNRNGDPRYFFFDTTLDNALGIEWKYYTFTFTNLDRGSSFSSTYNRIELYAPSQKGVLVKKIKVEKGTKATDWTPAPEDIDKKFTEVNSSVTAIDQKADSIRMSVNTLTQTVNGHTSNITTINTSITQMDGKITNKAEKSDVTAVDGKVTSVTDKVASLEVGINGISTLVSSKVSQADVNKSIIDAKTVKDTRNTNENPQYYWTNYKKQKVEEFKNRSVLAAPGSVTYGYLSTDVPWSDSSGGPIIQRFASADGTYERRSSSGTAWTSWVQIESTAGSQAKVNALKAGEVDPLKNRVSSTETSITQIESEITFKASQESVNLLTGRMSKAESSLTVQSKQIEAKVDSNGVIAAINLQPGTVKIKAGLIDLVGDVYITNGRVYISEGVVGTLAIADAAITRSKLELAIIGEAQIENGVIGNAKIRDVSADKIKVGTLTGITLSAVNIRGSNVESVNGTGKVILADGEIKSFINNDRVMSLDSDGLKIWSDFNFIAGTLRGRNRSSSKFGIELMAHREYLSLGFRVTGTQINEPWIEMARDSETNYTSIFGGNRDGSDFGDLRLYASGGRYLGNGGGVPRTEIRNYNTDLKWGGIINWIGRDYDAQDRDDERFSYEIWQYDGTGDRSSTQLFKVDRRVTNIYSQQAYLPDQTFLKTSNNQYDNALAVVLNSSIRVHGNPTININPIISAYEIEVTFNPGSGYSIMRRVNLSGSKYVWGVWLQLRDGRSNYFNATPQNISSSGFDLWITISDGSNRDAYAGTKLTLNYFVLMQRN